MSDTDNIRENETNAEKTTESESLPEAEAVNEAEATDKAEDVTGSTDVAEPASPEKAADKGKPAKNEKKPKEKKKKGGGKFWGRFVAFWLGVIIGLLGMVGGLVGGIVWAYGGLTLDTLQNWGIHTEGLDAMFDDDAEVNAMHMSFKELLEEMAFLSSNHMTLNDMVDRYGINFSEDFDKYVPYDLFDIPVDKLFSDKGGDEIKNALTIGYLLSLGGEGVLHVDVEKALRDKPIGLIIDGKLAETFEGIKLGYLTGVEHTHNPDGSISPIYKNPDAPTLMELLANVELSNLFDTISNNGDFLGLVVEEAGNEDVSVLFGGNSDVFGDVLDDKKVSDVIVYNEASGTYTIGFVDLIDDVKLGGVMGYTYDDENSVWLDGDGKEASGVVAKFASYTIGELQDADFEEEISDLSVAEILGYTEKDGKWYDDKDEELKGIMRVIAPCRINEVEEKVEETELGYLLGYTYDEESGIWYDYDIEVVGVMRRIVESTPATINEDMDTFLMGDAMNLTYDEKNGIWLDSEGNKADNLMASLAGLSVSDVRDPDKVTETVRDISVADLLGYRYVGGNWYEVYDPEKPYKNVKLDGFRAAIAGKKLGELNSALSDITVEDVFGDEVVNKGVFKLIPSDTKVDELDAALDDVFDKDTGATMGELVDLELLVFENSTIASLDAVMPAWRTYTLNHFIEELVP